MRTIIVMFDSLNRRFLPNYGCDWVKAPNFERLGKRTVTFDNAFIGSMPCMPARREMHTGRYNFLHRSWGPMEPFDDSAPEILKQNGIYTHLASDHQHYWEDGGATYHTRYSSWEAFRGQEGDPWKADLNPGIRPTHNITTGNPIARTGNYLINRMPVQDMINRSYCDEEKKMPQAQTFAAGMEFLNRNWTYDNWMLQIETFDPHEPFFTQKEYQALYEDIPVGHDIDWPPYGPCTSSEEIVKHVRNKYAALISMCDNYLGKVLDFMDVHDMWKDTALIVTTDHGYLLGEREWWAKSIMPYYNEIAHIPMFAWDPRVGKKNEHRKSLVQNIDVAATVLELNGLQPTKDMQGKPLKDVIDHDEVIHDCVLFGSHGNHINVTDGHHIYMKAPLTRENGPYYEYTLMPTHMRNMFTPKEMQDMELVDGFSFTKGLKVLKIQGGGGSQMSGAYRYGTKLYDVDADPTETQTIEDLDVELDMIHKMQRLMHETDAPSEQYTRIGVPEDHDMTMEELVAQKEFIAKNDAVAPVEGYQWQPEAKEQFLALTMFANRPDLPEVFKAYAEKNGLTEVTTKTLENFVGEIMPPEAMGPVLNVMNMLGRKN